MQTWILAVALTLSLALLNYQYHVWHHTPVPEAVGTVLHELETARELAAATAELLASPAAADIPVPVVGVSRSAVADTFGEPRGADRTHEGTDIFAPRGTYVVSATRGIVARMSTNRLGGNVVLVTGPGGERYYYAHLDEIDPALQVGMQVGTTTVLGRVGTSGNATGTPPHLHLGIYGPGGARNPFERLIP